VAFFVALDTGEEGLRIWTKGMLQLIGNTGTVIPGLGTVANLDDPGILLPVGQNLLIVNISLGEASLGSAASC
jgi:hypothetical protein